jgi:hypothetical protein
MIEDKAAFDYAVEVLHASGRVVISRATWIEINRVRRRAAAGLPVSEDELTQIVYALNSAIE